MKRFFSSWQGLLAGILAILIFLYSPQAVHWIAPTAGILDVGAYLQWIIAATTIAFFGVFVAWACWQLAFPSMDKWADGKLSEAFELLPAWAKVLFVQASFALLIVYWIACLLVVPME